VAASAAQALAYASELPVCRVSSLAALAVPELNPDRSVAVCLDARMGEAYVGIYKLVEGELICELEDQLVDPRAFRLTDIARDAIALGAGWKEWEDMLIGFEGAVINNRYPQAQDVLLSAERMYANNETVLPQEALPNYVRNKVTQ
ncbi:MAG: tRNA (adenosine(37)-N6)-threonylcarbamoyltransferase complex dimerization subunit type 1 TsaB, partial [Gammaproteobacteria bacterium]